MEKFRKDIHKVIDSKDLDPVHIEINDQKQSSLQQELAALVKIVQMESNYHQGHQNQLASPSGQFRDQTIISPSANRSGFGQGSANQSQIPVPVKLKPQSQLNIDQDQETGAYELNLQTNKTQLEVNLKDYFLPDCQRKYLHFFVQEEDCTKLYYCDVEQDKTRYQEIKLGPDQFAPDFHKSIILPNGDIYLIGGTSLSGQKSNQISKFDWNSKELVPVAEMKYPRSSHALAYLNEKIYIIGGYTTNADKKSSLTKSVEEFDISTKRVRQVASLNQGVVSAAATGFNGKYLFKFGGMTEQRQMSAVIEKYDPQFDTWSVIDPRISPQPLQILSTGCCGQINESQIMVFGGYNQDNYSSRQCFLFQVDENNDGNCAIKCINWKPLPVQEGFWNNQAFVWRGVLYAQQNVTSENQIDCKQNERHVLGFQGDDWLVLNQH
ncbi:hypothetical protein PPERSA_01436 [Pseudocohnilembus persalinus]|uniref:Attractin/MKLN-like beta-propeller domain-containing protein n=1 Tax=Pseudocohnilembus persalinus TaxID=266149 RepID=A0A0V0QH28_PSEPJ|nr:hypothetical protein PPERSA_01436 [Pseudocohnilembus persalinus]|eukprot:KRX01533.1 hypothetical protein PPERSA_01436 [Pseudocohnilembus persalinus]